MSLRLDVTDPKMLSASERADELARLLARGIQRLQAQQSPLHGAQAVPPDSSHTDLELIDHASLDPKVAG